MISKIVVFSAIDFLCKAFVLFLSTFQIYTLFPGSLDKDQL